MLRSHCQRLTGVLDFVQYYHIYYFYVPSNTYFIFLKWSLCFFSCVFVLFSNNVMKVKCLLAFCDRSSAAIHLATIP